MMLKAQFTPLLIFWLWLSGSGVTAQPLRVVVTVAPLYEFTQKVAGNQAEVTLLIKPGTEVHDYQARPLDILQIRQAQVVVKNGLGLEEFLGKLIANAESQPLILDSSLGVARLAGESAHPNPHIWLDPHRAQQQVRNIRDGLIRADPQHRHIYQTNAALYLGQLNQLEQEFRTQLRSHAGQSYVALTQAFSYLAQQYQLHEIALVPSTGALLTPRSLQTTLAKIQALGVPRVLSTTSADSRILNLIQQDLGLKIGTLDTLETGTSQGYVSTMRQNLYLLKQSLR